MSKKVPEGWRVAKLGDVAEAQSGGTPLRTNALYWDGTIPFMKIEDMTRAKKYLSATENFITEAGLKNSSARMFPSNTVFLAMYASFGCVCISKILCSCSQAILGFDKSQHIIPDYLYYLLISMKSSWRREVQTGSQPNLSKGLVLGKKVILPPLAEQEKIAEILGSVDAAIDSTRRVIDQTRSLKRALTQQLLTKGIPGRHAKFKDSPFGKIPQEWSVAPLATITKLQTGFPFKSSWFDESSKMRLVRGENVGVGRCDWSDARRIDTEKHGAFDEYRLSLGNIIIGMDRTFTKAGYKLTRIVESDLPALLVQRVGRFQPKECDEEYLFCVLKSDQYISKIKNNQKGSDLPHLSKTEILEPNIPIPPRREQAEIATFLASFEEKENKEQVLLSQLGILKVALMSALLSGNIRVSVNPKQEHRSAA